MFRKKEKQNSVIRAKSDPFAFVSPKKEEIQFQARIERIAFKKVPQRMAKAQPLACTALAFNSPRKKYAPNHQPRPTNNPSSSKLDKSQRDDTNIHHPKLKKILLEQRTNLRKQQRFLHLQQQKIDHENACLRQQIKQLQKNLRETQQSSTSKLINPLQKYMQKRNCMEAASTSDTFLVM